jgi:hypothetical protein
VSSGFHFCEKVDEVLRYYDIEDKEFVLFEINAIGDVESENDKSCTNKIEIVRIIPKSEYNSLFQTTTFEFYDDGSVKNYKSADRDVHYHQNGRISYVRNISGYDYKYDENGHCIWRGSPGDAWSGNELSN